MAVTSLPLVLGLLASFNNINGYLLSSSNQMTLDKERKSVFTQPLFVDLGSVAFNVSSQYLSVTIDAGQISQGWRVIDFTSPRVVNLARGLSPALLRVGGTSQDFILFSSSSAKVVNGSSGSSEPSRSNFTMNVSEWDAVNQFTEKVDWDFIFGLNVLLRRPWPNGTWDTTNAEELMDYTARKGYHVNWELGNG